MFHLRVDFLHHESSPAVQWATSEWENDIFIKVEYVSILPGGFHLLQFMD